MNRPGFSIDSRPLVFGSAVSSVVEHYLDTVGVTGSNPVSRTISPQTVSSLLLHEIGIFAVIRVQISDHTNPAI